MDSILITGANRGLGLAFVRAYLAKGWRVFACCRFPDSAQDLQTLLTDTDGQLSLHPLELIDTQQIKNLAEQLREEKIDIILNNAGVFGPSGVNLGDVNQHCNEWLQVFQINAMAPVLLAEALLPQLLAGEKKIIASVSSAMGSLSENTELGGRYIYRSSKSALNMGMRSLAVDLKKQFVTSVMLNPGWVRTDMGGDDASLSPDESVARLIKILDNVTLGDSGKFLSHDGRTMMW